MRPPTDSNRGLATPAPIAPPPPAAPSKPLYGTHEEETRNFAVMALYQVLLRIGWIFKTESIIMPAFLDTIAGAGWVRGFLPALNRFGQSVPPVLFSERLRKMPRKKWALVACQVAMSAAFLTLAAIWGWIGGQASAWMPAAFLLIYGVFFSFTGLSQLAAGTLQGKLIRPNRRGRQLLVSTTLGSIFACSAAWWLLGDWLALPDGGFTWIFAITGGFFALAAVASSLLREAADVEDANRPASRGRFHDAREVLRRDANFRRLAVVAMLFGTVVVLFPHYQALARESLGSSMNHLVLWVIVQNAGVGVFSIFVGPLADRRGNRLVLQCVLFAGALAPLLAVVFVHVPQWGEHGFWVIFALLGLTPVTFKTLLNYTLECCRPAEHPKYLSTLNLCLAAPFVLSPAVGWLIDLAGFEAVLLGGSALIIGGGLLSLTLDEPRNAA